MPYSYAAYTGNGSTTQFNVTFPYIRKEHVKVYVNYVDTAYTWVNDSTVQLASAPGAGVRVEVRRITPLNAPLVDYTDGSTLVAGDLDTSNLQHLYKQQELDDDNKQAVYIDPATGLVTANGQRITSVADPTNAQDAATKNYVDTTTVASAGDTMTGALNMGTNKITDLGTPTSAADATTKQYVDSTTWNVTTETIQSTEVWVDSDDYVATTGAIDDRIDAKIDTALTTDIATDGTGITVTDDGDGTITLGLAANSVDFDRIKDEDIITQPEQDAASVSPTDGNLFTSLAAARRFDTIVQTTTPSGSQWQVGKTWLQNDQDKTLSVWDGAAWVGISSGGTFTSQTTVVYVDAVNGDDVNDGHRISRPKATIKAAINQINSEITTSIANGGSGYVEGVYTGVALTGGSGSGLLANITVNASGVVTAVTIANPSTLVDSYAIGDSLSANNAGLGGSGSGLLISVGGTGDGQVVIVAPGVYQEVAPIQIKRRDVSVIGQAIRSCIVHPTAATETNTLFQVNSGSYLAGLTFTGVKASGSRGAAGSIDPDAVYGLPPTQGWNVAFYPGCRVIKSPYIQNCTNFSDSEIDNSNLNPHNPAGGAGGDTDSAPTGGGLLVDGSVPAASSPLRSMVCDSYTHVGLDGPGILVTNNGYAQCTSSYSFFNHYHIKCLKGGQANLAASTTDFGRYSLIADGRSTNAIFTSTTTALADDGDVTFTIDTPTPGSPWHGSATRPQSNMLVDIGGNTYPILSAVANGTGWDVTISRPDPGDKSTNLGLDGSVASGSTVEFYLRSMIASSGHTMEYVGSGTNYSALPENGGVPVENNQVIEINGGKVWAAITDHNGKFKLGDTLTVDQQIGFVTIPSGSIAFDLASDPSPQLSAALDAASHKINNVTDPTASQDAATKNYVDNALSGLSQNSISQSNSNVTVTDDGVAAGEVRVTVDGSTAIFYAANGTNAYFPTFHQNTLGLSNQNDLRFFELAANGNNYLAFQPPASIASNVTWTLPAADGSSNEVLATDGSGNLSWRSISGSSIATGNSAVEVIDTGTGYVSITADGNEIARFDSANGIDALKEFFTSNNIRIIANPTSGLGELRFAEQSTNGTNYVSFKPPATIAANVTWTLPATDATVAGHALKSDAAGNLSWGTAGGASGAGGDDVFYENGQTVTTSYTLTAGKNAMSAGPITINSGATVTVGSGQSWVIV